MASKGMLINETVVFEEKDAAGKIQILQNLKDKSYHFRIISGRNIIIWSEQYKRLQGVLRGVAALQKFKTKPAAYYAAQLKIKL